jgi:hypothetical protein
MQLTCTQTFENTADVYYDRLSDEEYAIRFKKHREENLLKSTGRKIFLASPLNSVIDKL